MKILIVTPTFPYPLNCGANIRIYNLIKVLSSHNTIDLVSIADRNVSDADLDELLKYCGSIRLAAVERKPKLLQVPKVIGRFLAGRPFSLKYVESPQLEALLRGISEHDGYDIIQFEHSTMAYYVEQLNPELNAAKILTFHNICSAQYYRMFTAERNVIRKIRWFLEWLPMVRWEPTKAARFHKLIVVSAMDRHLLLFLNPDLDISVIPNGVDIDHFTAYDSEEREKNVLFVGALDYEPNSDAVRYFHEEIFPIVRLAIPDVTMTVVGRNPPADIRALSRDPAVTVMGNVDDVRPFYRKAMLSAVALRSGGGTRLKILESMAAETPVVSTGIGCEGIDVRDGHNILVANDRQTFAEKVTWLMSRPQLWKTISEGGRNLAEESYDWKYLGGRLQSIYEQDMAGGTGNSCRVN